MLRPMHIRHLLASVLAEGGAADRKDIIFLQKLPVFNADGTTK